VRCIGGCAKQELWGYLSARLTTRVVFLFLSLSVDLLCLLSVSLQLCSLSRSAFVDLRINSRSPARKFSNFPKVSKVNFKSNIKLLIKLKSV